MSAAATGRWFAVAMALAATATVAPTGIAPWVGPGSVHGQDTADLLSEARLEYRSSLNAHQAALDAWAAADRRFQRANQEVQDALAAGDEDRLAAAFRQAQSLAVEVQDLEERVREQAELLEEDRAALVESLDARIETYFAELSATTNPDEQEDLSDLIMNLRLELREVESTGGPELEALPVSSYVIRFDPRDLPRDLELKAQMSEIRAGQFQQQIDEIDAQIEDLERRLRRDRSLDDFRAGIQRFGDDQAPVLPSDPASQPGSAGSGEEPSDSTGVRSRPQTLEERIEGLELYRDRLVEIRRQNLIQADLFRERLREVGL